MYGARVVPPGPFKLGILQATSTGGPSGVKPGPWLGINPFEASAWGQVSKAFTGVAGKTNFLQSASPASLWSQNFWTNQVVNLPGGGAIENDFLHYVGQVCDTIAGALDTISAGLVSRYVSWMSSLYGINFSALIDSTSEAYQTGAMIG
jgi:hypothetical protein